MATGLDDRVGAVIGWLRRMTERIDRIADEPADPTLLSARTNRRRRAGRPRRSGVETRVRDDRSAPDREPEDALAELERIQANQRRRMRGRIRSGDE